MCQVIGARLWFTGACQRFMGPFLRFMGACLRFIVSFSRFISDFPRFVGARLRFMAGLSMFSMTVQDDIMPILVASGRKTNHLNFLGCSSAKNATIQPKLDSFFDRAVEIPLSIPRAL